MINEGLTVFKENSRMCVRLFATHPANALRNLTNKVSSTMRLLISSKIMFILVFQLTQQTL